MIRNHKLIIRIHNLKSSFLSFKLSSSNSLSNNHLNQLYQIRNYSFGNDRFNNNYKPGVSSKRNRFFPKKDDNAELDNLGLDKYAELFEKNLNAFNVEKGIEESVTESKFYGKFIEERKFHEHAIEDFKLIYKDDEKLKKRIQSILKIYTLEKYDTSKVQTKISIDDMNDLLELDDDQETVLKHLNHLFFKESKKAYRKMKHEVEKKITSKRLEETHSNSLQRSGLEFEQDTGRPIYAKWKNTYFIAFNKESLRKESDRRILESIQFGPRLVLDFGYDDELLAKRTFSTLTTQLVFMLQEINKAKRPFHLNFCNLRKNSDIEKHLQKNFNFIYQPNSLHRVTHKSYLDLFPREDLVYLSAHSSRTLTSVDTEKVYIVGGFCNKYKGGQHSFQKAMAEKLPVYKLPLEDYFFFKTDRSLPINLCIGILENYLETESWTKSLIGKIPIRKLKTPEEIRFEQLSKIKKYYSKEKFFKVYRMNDQNKPYEVNKPYSSN